MVSVPKFVVYFTVLCPLLSNLFLLKNFLVDLKNNNKKNTNHFLYTENEHNKNILQSRINVFDIIVDTAKTLCTIFKGLRSLYTQYNPNENKNILKSNMAIEYFIEILSKCLKKLLKFSANSINLDKVFGNKKFKYFASSGIGMKDLSDLTSDNKSTTPPSTGTALPPSTPTPTVDFLTYITNFVNDNKIPSIIYGPTQSNIKTWITHEKFKAFRDRIDWPYEGQTSLALQVKKLLFFDYISVTYFGGISQKVSLKSYSWETHREILECIKSNGKIYKYNDKIEIDPEGRQRLDGFVTQWLLNDMGISDRYIRKARKLS